MPLLIPLAFLNTCAGDESIAGYVDPSAEYHLVEIDGEAINLRATITFPSAGEVVGQAPCNRYFATQTVPYPWFSLDGIGATRMACPDMAAETAFFTALQDMTLSEASGDTLILSNSDGRQMVFAAR
ncbi:MAG: META domain-containing protein [Octadecabacter sp.]